MRIDAAIVSLERFGHAFLTGRELVPFAAPPVPAVVQDAAPEKTEGGGPTPFDRLTAGIDIRNISPRQIADLSLDLYAAGILSWQEYDMLAFQPEMHPAYDRTVGALTGEKADPDRPRDFIAIWEARLAFERRHNAADHELIDRTGHIASVLRRIGAPTNLTV